MGKVSLKSPEHIQAQKEKILEAAKKAFRMHGFHSATMSQIAKNAGVSQGLAYRYFENKDTIIETIVVEEQRKMQVFIKGLKSFEDMVNSSIEHIKMLSSPQPEQDCMDPIIYLELRSEANRNPNIESVIQSWDVTDMSLLHAFINDCYIQAGRTVEESLIESRVNLMSAIFDGFSMRVKSLNQMFTDDMEKELRKAFKSVFEL